MPSFKSLFDGYDPTVWARKDTGVGGLTPARAKLMRVINILQAAETRRRVRQRDAGCMIDPDYPALFEALTEFNALIDSSLKMSRSLKERVRSIARDVSGRVNWHLGAMVGRQLSSPKTQKLLDEMSEFRRMLEPSRAGKIGHPKIEDTADLNDFRIVSEFADVSLTKARINDAAKRGLLDPKKSTEANRKYIERRLDRLGYQLRSQKSADE